MANNCLFKKLNGIADNDSLPIYNAIIIPLRSNLDQVSDSNRYINVTWHTDLATGNEKLRNIGGNFLDAQGNVIGTELTIQQISGKVYFSANTKEIIIFGENALRSIEDPNYGFLNLDLSQLKYCSAIYNLNISGRNKTGDLSELPESSRWVQLILSSVSITGDVASLPTTLPSFILYNNSTNLEGDFASLAEKRGAGTMTVRTEGIGLQNVKVNGNLLSSYGSSPYTLTFDGEGHVTCSGS